MRTLSFAVTVALGLLASQSAQAITLDFSANVGSQIQFVGNGTTTSISLIGGAGGHNFQITSESGGDGSGLGVQGDITGGGFSYTTPIAVSGPTQTANLATVAGTQLHLGPAGGATLTADLTGVNISTTGNNGGTNFTGTVNLANITYAGTNADLLAFKNEATAPGNGGVAALSFQFSGPTSLTQLLGPGAHLTSYSGTVSVTPEPGSMAMACTGVFMLGGLGYRRARRLKAA